MKKVFAIALALMMILTAAMALSGCKDNDRIRCATVVAPDGAVAHTNPSGNTTGFYKNEYDEGQPFCPQL